MRECRAGISDSVARRREKVGSGIKINEAKTRSEVKKK